MASKYVCIRETTKPRNHGIRATYLNRGHSFIRTTGLLSTESFVARPAISGRWLELIFWCKVLKTRVGKLWFILKGVFLNVTKVSVTNEMITACQAHVQKDDSLAPWMYTFHISLRYHSLLDTNPDICDFLKNRQWKKDGGGIIQETCLSGKK
jgi:hypothetical protein